MKKICNIFYALVLITTIFLSINLSATDVYRQEFKAFKKTQKYKAMFDHDAYIAVKLIRRNIQNFSQLNLFQRFIRWAFLSCDAVVITPETMPQLYNYIDNLCKKHSIDTPTVFLTRKRGFFNAFAAKLLWSSGAVIIGQHLLRTTSDDTLEAVITHEIGHIKYNHVNKTIGLNLLNMYLCHYILTLSMSSTTNPWQRFLTSTYLAPYMTAFMINKRFEKEADRFAYEENNKDKGLIQLFEHLKQQDIDRDNDLSLTRKILTIHKPDIDFLSYYIGLVPFYYLTKLGHLLLKGYKWVYYNTPYGPHPSPEARITTVKKYLAQQQLLSQGKQNV